MRCEVFPSCERLRWQHRPEQLITFSFVGITLNAAQNVHLHSSQSNPPDKCRRGSSEKVWQALRNCLLPKQSDTLEKRNVSKYATASSVTQLVNELDYKKYLYFISVKRILMKSYKPTLFSQMFPKAK